MLKGIPSIISPELLKILCEMGHSDIIVIADGNFPAVSSDGGKASRRVFACLRGRTRYLPLFCARPLHAPPPASAAGRRRYQPEN